MKRLLSIALLLLTACSGLNPTRPSTPQTTAQPQSEPVATPKNTAALTVSPATFPNADDYHWQEIVTGLKRPIDLQDAGDGRLFIAVNPGRIRIYENGELLETPLLDIEDRVNDVGNEMGLLGLALHPDFLQNGYLFVNYTGKNGETVIARFQAHSNTADPNSEMILLKIKQPFENHNGGGLAFGPDGYLYIATGDGGAAGDPMGNGQSLDVLLGKILRLDVDAAEPYTIPADNPFGNEILHYGLRNPWRISFDTLTGALFIADVGQGEWEEVNHVPFGARHGLNFGWDYYEGNHDYDLQGIAGEYTFPIAEYSHAEGGCSITGGYVYRGAMTEWAGVYLYGDYCTGKVWGAINANGQWQAQLLFEAGVQITSFGQDVNGEVYLLSDQGNVYQLVRK